MPREHDVFADLADVPADDLARLTTELARQGLRGSDRWHAVQSELSRRRSNAHRADDVRPDERLSIRAQLIRELATSPERTSTQLARSINRGTTVVSRVLTTLLDEEVVSYTKDADDGRVRRYRLIAQDAPATTRLSPDEAEEQHLALMISAAARARRMGNDLTYAADRLERVVNRANAIGLHNLALVARRELVTTLRQLERFDDVRLHLAELERMKDGKLAIPAELVGPVIGCLEYEAGRTEGGSDNERLDHLTTAASIFRSCSSLPSAQDWCPREGWALLASAEIWHRHTEFGVSLEYAMRATDVFEVYDDTYAMAEAMRLRGRCHRLRGDFGAAIEELTVAQALAAQAKSDRCIADVLFELGDAYRCIGTPATARELLLEAASMAESMHRNDTLANCLLAMAAAEHTAGEFDAAWQHANDAASQLESDSAGWALAMRRLGVIVRDLGADAPSGAEQSSRQYFEHALTYYKKTNSPAGAAACCIGLARAAVTDEQMKWAVDDLFVMASSGAGRLLLPLDPWVPTLIMDYAERSTDTKVRRVADWMYRSDQTSDRVDEMAGEPRYESFLFAA